MDSACKVMRSLKLPGASVSDGDLVRAAWPRVVGKRIAGVARAVGFNENRLIVEVEDAIWESQLRTMERHITRKIRETVGDDWLRGIDFRVGTPRRMPQRAETARPADEADDIQDFALRKVYKASRQRALFA